MAGSGTLLTLQCQWQLIHTVGLLCTFHPVQDLKPGLQLTTNCHSLLALLFIPRLIGLPGLCLIPLLNALPCLEIVAFQRYGAREGCERKALLAVTAQTARAPRQRSLKWHHGPFSSVLLWETICRRWHANGRESHRYEGRITAQQEKCSQSWYNHKLVQHQ